MSKDNKKLGPYDFLGKEFFEIPEDCDLQGVDDESLMSAGRSAIIVTTINSLGEERMRTVHDLLIRTPLPKEELREILSGFGVKERQISYVIEHITHPDVLKRVTRSIKPKNVDDVLMQLTTYDILIIEFTIKGKLQALMESLIDLATSDKDDAYSDIFAKHGLNKDDIFELEIALNGNYKLLAEMIDRNSGGILSLKNLTLILKMFNPNQILGVIWYLKSSSEVRIDVKSKLRFTDEQCEYLEGLDKRTQEVIVNSFFQWMN